MNVRPDPLGVGYDPDMTDTDTNDPDTHIDDTQLESLAQPLQKTVAGSI